MPHILKGRAACPQAAAMHQYSTLSQQMPINLNLYHMQKGLIGWRVYPAILPRDPFVTIVVPLSSRTEPVLPTTLSYTTRQKE